jgi:hypothetical protein
MLQVVGFGNVQFRPENRNKVLSAESHPLPGYLLANGIEANGRVLGLVYPGVPDAGIGDADRQWVDEAKLEASVNAALVRDGLAYAELYSTMPIDLIKRMRLLVKAARTAGIGFWKDEDISKTARVRLDGLADLPELVMFPKLYRRFVKYFEDGYVGLGQFDAWMRDDVKRDDRALLPTGELGNLHDLYDIGRGGIKLEFFPEDLTFEPDVTPT